MAKDSARLRRVRRKTAAPAELNEQLLNAPQHPVNQPHDVVQMQRVIGNRATMSILQRTPFPQRTIQRDPTEVFENVKAGSDKVIETGSLLGSIEWIKPKDGSQQSKDSASAQNTQNAAITGVATSGPSLILNTINTGVQGHKAEQIRKERAGLQDKGGTEYMALTEDYHKHVKGASEGGANMASNIYSIVVNSLQIAKTLAEKTATVLGVVGAGVGAAFSLLSLIRDSVNIHKRKGRAKKLAEVRASYESRGTTITNEVKGKEQEVLNLATENKQHQDDIADKRDELDQVNQELSKTGDDALTGDEKTQAENKAKTLQEDVDTLLDKVKKNEDKSAILKSESDELLKTVQEYKERGIALGVADRKLGNKLKGVSVASSIMGLIGSGVGIAGLLLAGTAAAAVLGPVGWAIGGLILAVGIGVMIGMAVKRKIRANNVKRMKSERDQIKELIAKGTGPAAAKYPSVATMGVEDRKNLVWNRDFFPTDPMKKKSSKDPAMSLQARLDYLTEYLAKYDVEAAGDAVWYGVLDAMVGAEGSQNVPNPAKIKWDQLSPSKKNKVPQPKAEITLREQFTNLIKDFYPKDGDKIIADIDGVGKKWYDGQKNNPQVTLDPAEEKKFLAAKKLVLKKMKVGG